jgi:hypothetical protein
MTFRVTNIPTRGLRGVAAWLVMAIATPILLLLMLISALVYGFNEAVDNWRDEWRDLRKLFAEAWPYLAFKRETE